MSHTGNPRAPQIHPDDAPQESTGPVAADSLAAESYKAGGGFAENQDATPLGVKGGSSTLNTTDTSGAQVLHAARSGAEREKQDALGLGVDEKGVTGIKYPEGAPIPEFSGATTALGYSGGPSSGSAGASSSDAPAGASDFGSNTLSSSSSTGDSNIRSSGNTGSNVTTSGSTGSGSASGITAGAAPYVDKAPTYAARVAGNLDTEGELQPKGENLTEGGIPQTKTFTGDVGGPHDPGRLAERDFEKINAAAAGDGARDSTQSGSRNKPGEGSTGQYDVLSSERA